MSNTKQTGHTPGPWRVKRSTTFVNGDLFEYSWIGVGPIGDETPVTSRFLLENEANARLIAACPEMYEALKTVLEFVDSGGLGAGINAHAKATLEQFLSKAIAKAEGGSNE